MIVIAIIGILAAIALPAYAKYMARVFVITKKIRNNLSHRAYLWVKTESYAR